MPASNRLEAASASFGLSRRCACEFVSAIRREHFRSLGVVAPVDLQRTAYQLRRADRADSEIESEVGGGKGGEAVGIRREIDQQAGVAPK